MKASEIIEKLRLSEHPEGGFFRQTYKSELIVQPHKEIHTRAAVTHIYYFLQEGTHSRFHKVKHDEIWNLYDGEGIKLYLFDAVRNRVDDRILSANNFNYHTVIPGGIWQAAEPIGDYALVGCTVAPGYEIEDEIYLFDDAEASNKLIKLTPELKRLISPSLL